jgi:hypothetical protein
MPRKKAIAVVEPVVAPTNPTNNQTTVNELASALTQAIETARPTKLNIFTRKGKTPWDNKDGSPKPKLKRVFHQHGLIVDPAFLDSEEINLINKLKPGSFCGGLVKVTRRRDKGIDIDWPVKEVSQRLKLISVWGLRNLKEIAAHCIDEAAKPRFSENLDELDD